MTFVTLAAEVAAQKFAGQTPTVREIHIEGIDAACLPEVLDSLRMRRGTPYSNYVASLDRELIEAACRANGYMFAQVQMLPATLEDAVDVHVVVDPGPQVAVDVIDITGAPPSAAAELEDVIRRLRVRGILAERDIDRVSLALTLRCEDLGFLDAVVALAAVHYSPDKRRVVLEIGVEAGARYTVDRVDFIGNSLFDSATLSGLLALKHGQPFVRDRLLGDYDALALHYRRHGRPLFEANVRSVVAPDTREVTLRYSISEGPPENAGPVKAPVSPPQAWVRLDPRLFNAQLERPAAALRLVPAPSDATLHGVGARWRGARHPSGTDATTRSDVLVHLIETEPDALGEETSTLLRDTLRTDPNPFVRAQAAWVLGQSTYARDHVEWLLAAVADSSHLVRYDAILSLAEVSARADASQIVEVRKALAKRLAALDEHLWVRIHAARGLSRLPPSSDAIPTLIACLDHSDVKLNAYRALRILTGWDLPAQRRAWEERWRSASRGR